MREHLAFLIDENLSPELARWAQARGLRALHATWARLPGKPGHQVTAYAVSGDFIPVANSVDDFRMLYRRMETILASSSSRSPTLMPWIETHVDGKWEVVVEGELLARS